MKYLLFKLGIPIIIGFSCCLKSFVDPINSHYLNEFPIFEDIDKLDVDRKNIINKYVELISKEINWEFQSLKNQHNVQYLVPESNYDEDRQLAIRKIMHQLIKNGETVIGVRQTTENNDFEFIHREVYRISKTVKTACFARPGFLKPVDKETPFIYPSTTQKHLASFAKKPYIHIETKYLQSAINQNVRDLKDNANVIWDCNLSILYKTRYPDNIGIRAKPIKLDQCK